MEMSLAQLFLIVEVSDSTVALASGLITLPFLHAINPKASSTAHSITVFFIIFGVYLSPI
jgi:hypothetical protein